MSTTPESPSDELRISGLSPEAFEQAADFVRSLGGTIICESAVPPEEVEPRIADTYLRFEQFKKFSSSRQPGALWRTLGDIDAQLEPAERLIQQGPSGDRLSANNTASFVFGLMTGKTGKPEDFGETATRTLIDIDYAFSKPHRARLPKELPEIELLPELGDRPAFTGATIEAHVQNLYGRKRGGIGATISSIRTMLTSEIAYGWHLADTVTTGGVQLRNTHRPSFGFDNTNLTAVTIDRLKVAFEQAPPHNLRPRYVVSSLLKSVALCEVAFEEPEPCGKPPVHFLDARPQHSSKHSGPKALGALLPFTSHTFVQEISHAARKGMYYPASETLTDPASSDPEIIPHTVSDMMDSIFLHETLTLEQAGINDGQARMLLTFMAAHRSIDTTLAHHTASHSQRSSIDYAAVARLAEVLGVDHDSAAVEQKINKIFRRNVYYAYKHDRDLTSETPSVRWFLDNPREFIASASHEPQLPLHEAYLIARYWSLLRDANRDQ